MRIVFVGAGHASLLALRALGPLPGTELTLISDGPRAHYSGMVPGWIEGLYGDGAMDVPLAAFAAAHGLTFLDARVGEITEDAVLTDGGPVAYDHLVLNTGAVAAPIAAGPAPASLIPAKPFSALLAGLGRQLDSAASFAIVGAGAAGTEVAFAIRRRRPDAAITLVEARAQILSAFPATFRRRVGRHLAAAGIGVRTGTAPCGADDGGVHLADGTLVSAACTLAFTGAAPPPLLAAAPFAKAPDGFIATDRSMRSLSHPHVLAVGDTATTVDDPRPKAGVFAVRQGRPLARAIRALAAGRTPPPVHLQRHALVLLSVGARRAIGVRNGLVVEGRAVWQLKDRLDRRFIARLTAPPRR
ncbi:MAG: FAD-dependent oxidoreductase [Acuticoccus sp.]